MHEPDYDETTSEEELPSHANIEDSSHQNFMPKKDLLSHKNIEVLSDVLPKSDFHN